MASIHHGIKVSFGLNACMAGFLGRDAVKYKIFKLAIMLAEVTSSWPTLGHK